MTLNKGIEIRSIGGIVQKILLLILLPQFLASCSTHYGTEVDNRFQNISNLSELDGIYKNKGDWSGSGTLAEIIWHDHSNQKPVLDYNQVEFIEVLSSTNSLTVKAIQNGCSIYSRKYILGEDFDLDNGKIIIQREFHALSRGGGDVLVGPSFEKKVLGLDSSLNGKFKSTVYASGLAFLFIPFAGSETRDVRFERISTNPKLFDECKIR